MAGALARAGVGPGDRVAIFVGNDGAIEAHTTYHAIHRLGAIAVPINTFYVARELEYAFGLVEPRAIVFASQFAEVVDGALGDGRRCSRSARAPLGEPRGALLDATTEHASAGEVDENDDGDGSSHRARPAIPKPSR